MNKKKIIAVIDTETCSLIGGVYDIALVITDKKGRIEYAQDYLVREIVTDHKKMMGAYYAGKSFTHYIPALNDGKIKLKSWEGIRREFLDILKFFNVDTVAAYNLGFDSRAILKTHEELGNTGKWLHGKFDLLCLWEFACVTIFQQANYKNAARTFGWVSDAGNIRTTAEHAYRYLSTDIHHAENHTALQDAVEENYIMARCFATKKRVPYNIINGKTWRHVNPK